MSEIERTEWAAGARQVGEICFPCCALSVVVRGAAEPALDSCAAWEISYVLGPNRVGVNFWCGAGC